MNYSSGYGLNVVWSAQVVALTVAIGVLKGADSHIFAFGLVFSLVVRSWLATPCME